MNLLITYLLWTAYFISLFFSTFWLITFLLEDRKPRQHPLTTHPKVSIIIPAYNEEKNITNTITSVLALEYPPKQIEILIVDDGSTDDTATVVKTLITSRKKTNTPTIHLLHQPNRGKGAALNNGLNHCTGEFFVCLDADSMPEPNVLPILLPPFYEDPTIAASLPALKIQRGGGLLQKMQRYEYIVNMFYKELMAKLDCVRVTPGPFAVYRTETLRKLGGFDENANLTEDLEMALRLQQHHYRIVQSVEASVYTIPPLTLRGLYKQRNRWYKGSVLNTLDYKKLLLNRRYGDFGMMEMPTALISGVLIVFIVTTLLYYLIKPAIIGIYHFSLVNFDFITFIKNWAFNFHILDLDYSLILIGAAMTGASLYVLRKSHLINHEKIFKEGLLPFFLYVALYFILLGLMWVGILFDLILRRRQRW